METPLQKKKNANNKPHEWNNQAQKLSTFFGAMWNLKLIQRFTCYQNSTKMPT